MAMMIMATLLVIGVLDENRKGQVGIPVAKLSTQLRSTFGGAVKESSQNNIGNHCCIAVVFMMLNASPN